MSKSTQNKQLEELLAPVFAYNSLLINTAEKAFGLQVSIMQKLTKINFDNTKAMMNIKTADELKSYAEKQQDVAREVTEIVTDDARALGDLQQTFLNDSRKLVEKNIKQGTAKAA